MKTSRLLYWIFLTITAAVTIGIAISTFIVKEWAAFAATLAVIASLLTIYGSLKLNWRMEDAHDPFLNIYFDTTSHKFATGLVIRNDGGSTAYNIKIHWIKPLKDEDNTEVRFSNADDDIDVYSLPAGQSVSRYVRPTESFFPDGKESKPETFEGELIFYSSPNGRNSHKQKFKLSMALYKMRFMSLNDQMNFYFENRNLSRHIKELNQLISKLDQKDDH